MRGTRSYFAKWGLRALRFDDTLTMDCSGELLYPFQDDGFSCGACTWNTIERTVWSETAPWCSRYKQLERMEYALFLTTQNGSPYTLVRFIASFGDFFI